MSDACEICDRNVGHDEHCPLFAPHELTPDQHDERAAYRRQKALTATPEEIIAWLDKHARGMTPNSHNRLYIERAAELLRER